MKGLLERKKMVSKGHPKLSLSRQCSLLGVNRSGLYYQPCGESKLNLGLLAKIDACWLAHPEMGARSIHAWLRKDEGYEVNKKRVERLFYKVLGLSSLQPGKHNTSKPAAGHKKYPYLLRGVEATRANQVWAMDITYIPMRQGYLYLTAVIDLYSRFVVGWALSNTMEAAFCIDCLRQAVSHYGAPETLNTDQGAQFTSQGFTDYVESLGTRVSMDGKGRAIDNAFIERLWRSVKYEKVYLEPVSDGVALYEQLEGYFAYYNHQRRHQSLGYEPPASRYTPENRAVA